MILPASDCRLFTRRQLKAWHDVDWKGIASVGAVGLIGHRLWFDPYRLEAWVRDHSTRRPAVAEPEPWGVPTINVHPRKKKQASVAALA